MAPADGLTNDRAIASRDSWEDEGSVVTDIEFADAVADPIGQVARVYDAIGVPLTAEAESAMRHWLVHRPRESQRPSYALQTYGLSADQIDERFAQYTARFRPAAKYQGALDV